MKFKIILVVYLFSLTFLVQAQNNPLESSKLNGTMLPPKRSYAELVAELKSGNTNVDYKALRMAFTETKEYSYSGLDKEERDKMFKPFSGKKYKDALKEAEKIIEKNHVELNSEYIAYNSSQELKDEKKAAFYKAVLLGLLNAIQNGGDGKTAKTAFTAITINEEYTFMNIMGYKHSSQSLQHLDGHSYDVFDAVDSKNQKLKLYFNIDVIWKAETDLFGGK